MCPWMWKAIVNNCSQKYWDPHTRQVYVMLQASANYELKISCRRKWGAPANTSLENTTSNDNVVCSEDVSMRRVNTIQCDSGTTNQNMEPSMCSEQHATLPLPYSPEDYKQELSVCEKC